MGELIPQAGMPTRREFLATSSRAVAFSSLMPLLACGPDKQASTAHKEETAWEKNVADLERRIPQLLAELHVPGASVAIIRGARIVWRKSFGIRDRESGVLVDNDTIFEVQSMSKPVFAYRVMKLCEQGILSLDAPLTRYTPEVLIKGDPRLQLITARRVLSHTTGLPNWRSKKTPLILSFTPGEKFHYSGEGYNYLQRVITRLVGHTDSNHCSDFGEGNIVCASDFGDYMAANLLTPFGMTASGYVWTEEIGKKMARPHDTSGRPLPVRKSSAVDVARFGAAGSLLSTATDYAKFLIEVIDPRPADNYRLNAASRAEMLRPQVDVPSGPFPLSWALGWEILHMDKGDVIGHGGDIEGFHSQSAFSTATKSGYVIMTNGEGGYEMISKRLLNDLNEKFVLA
jgi:CubicO group peptidase (beta-lactamase class C family)